MSGSLPHTIAITNHTLPNSNSTGYTPFDQRSDEDKNIAALNARNAKASSDFVVTISEQGQALAQRNKPLPEETRTKSSVKKNTQESDVIEVEALDTQELASIQRIKNKHQDKLEGYHDNDKHTGDFLTDIV